MTHDEYGKKLFSDLLATRWFCMLCAQRWVEMRGVRADLDGVIWSEDLKRIDAAVKIEARTYKQVPGAMIDLAWHPAPSKLLVVILAQPQMGSEARPRKHLECVSKRLAAEQCGPFRLVIL